MPARYGPTRLHRASLVGSWALAAVCWLLVGRMVPGTGQVTDLLVDAVAVYRLTRLVTADTLLDPVREQVVEAAYVAEGRGEELREVAEATSWSEVAIAEGRHAPKLATLVTCRWCAGMWLAAGAVLARRLLPRAWRPLAEVLVCSAAAALLANLEDPS